MGSGVATWAVNPWLVVIGLVPLAALAVWLAKRLGVLPPPAIEPRHRGRESVMLPLLLGLGVMVGVSIAALIGQVTAQVPATAGSGASATPDLPTQARLAGVTYTLGLIVAIGAWWYLRGSEARVRPRTSAAMGIAGGFAGFGLVLPVVVLAMVLGQVLTTLLTGAPAPTLAHVTLAAIADPAAPMWAKVVLIAAVVLAAPIVEEVMYRGCVQTAISRATGSSWAGIGFTSAFFVLMHAAAVPREAWLGAGLTLSVLSVALGLAFARTGRIVTPIVIHACFNAANVTGALLVM